MLSWEMHELLDLDVQEFELMDPAAEVPGQQIPPRTITTCAIC